MQPSDVSEVGIHVASLGIRPCGRRQSVAADRVVRRPLPPPSVLQPAVVHQSILPLSPFQPSQVCPTGDGVDSIGQHGSRGVGGPTPRHGQAYYDE